MPDKDEDGVELFRDGAVSVKSLREETVWSNDEDMVSLSVCNGFADSRCDVDDEVSVASKRADDDAMFCGIDEGIK